MKKTWYKCDPKKNAKCSKTTCIHNPNAKYPKCDRTSSVECSIDMVPLK